MWSIFLAATLMLVGGCSYSFSHSTETSAGIGEDGKIDASASTSVYTERVENGKTVNNQVTASVGRRDESAADPKASARSGEGISYTVEDADLQKGEVEIVGVFANGGSQSIKIDKVYISFVFYDEKGKKSGRMRLSSRILTLLSSLGQRHRRLSSSRIQKPRPSMVRST